MERSFRLCGVRARLRQVDFVRPIEAVIPGAQGRVLEVLCNATAELNLRTIARLSGVSPAQASRVLPRLVELGLVERREVAPSSLFRLVREHVAAGALLELVGSPDTVLVEIGRLAEGLSCPPASVVVFGSFARREARIDSDIDLLVVRRDDVDEDDEQWATGIEGLRGAVGRLTGNSVSMLEVGTHEVGRQLTGRRPLWAEIRRPQKRLGELYLLRRGTSSK